jgi:hypothetical protein
MGDDLPRYPTQRNKKSDTGECKGHFHGFLYIFSGNIELKVFLLKFSALLPDKNYEAWIVSMIHFPRIAARV